MGVQADSAAGLADRDSAEGEMEAIMPEGQRVYSTRRDSRLRVPAREDVRVWIERPRTYDREGDRWHTDYEVHWQVPSLDSFGQAEAGYRSLSEAKERAEIVRMLLAIEAPVRVDPEIKAEAAMRKALDTIAHDHAAQSALFAKHGWQNTTEAKKAASIALKWAQDIAREGLKG